MLMLNILWADADLLQPTADMTISSYRKKKLALIKHERAMRCSLCVELLLNEAVRREDVHYPLPLKIETDTNGKPFLADHEYEFSLSHSAHFAACALSDAPVGLDIQTLCKCDEHLVRRFFTKGEQESALTSNDPDGAFTRLWCRKESYLKAIGTGLRLPLDSFDVSDRQATLFYQGLAYGFREYETDDLFFCVCMQLDKLPEGIAPQRLELP